MPQRSVREQLIEHAEDVFRQQGFSAASVQDLTVAAGVPKGSFYNHFASKQALASEILHAARDILNLGDRGVPVLVEREQHIGHRVASRVTAAPLAVDLKLHVPNLSASPGGP